MTSLHCIYTLPSVVLVYTLLVTCTRQPVGNTYCSLINKVVYQRALPSDQSLIFTTHFIIWPTPCNCQNIIQDLHLPRQLWLTLPAIKRLWKQLQCPGEPIFTILCLLVHEHWICTINRISPQPPPTTRVSINTIAQLLELKDSWKTGSSRSTFVAWTRMPKQAAGHFRVEEVFV